MKALSNAIKVLSTEYNAYQYIETAQSREEAIDILDALKLQDGYIGGRILEPRLQKSNDWQIQSFFDFDGSTEGLPNGVRPVFLTDSFKKMLSE